MEKKKTKASKFFLIIILVILLLIIFGAVFHTVRNYIIISNLQKTFKQYSGITNYHIKTSYDNESGHVEMDFYRKDDRKAEFLTFASNSGEVSKLMTYDTGKRVDLFTETNAEKHVQIDTGNSPNMNISNGLEEPLGGPSKILNAFNARIRKAEIDGKECFIIKGYLSGNILYDMNDASVSYIDKETALEFRRIINGRTEEKVTEFNNVDDSIFVEPNIGEYDLIKAN